jgi:hypothetical protein
MASLGSSLLYQRLQIYLKDYRLLTAFVGLLVLLPASSLVAASEFRHRVTAYGRLSVTAREAANLDRVYLPRPVSRLVFLARDAGEDYLDFVVVRPGLVDLPGREAGTQSLVSRFAAIDWRWIFLYFYSFMAIILAYDAVSGESEGGTLRVIMSAPVPRLTFLASRFLGCSLSLVLAAALAALLGLACGLAAGLPMRGADFVLVAAAGALLLLLLVLTVEVGLLASLASRRTATSLAIAASSWGILAFLLPGSMTLAADGISPAPSYLDFQKQLAAVNDAFERKMTIDSQLLSAIVDRHDLSVAGKLREIAALEDSLHRRAEVAFADYERDLARTRRGFLHLYFRQMQWRQRLGYLSPFSLVSRALERLAAAGEPGLLDFVEEAEAYEPELTAALDAARVRERARAQEQLIAVTTEDATGRSYTLRGLGGLSFAKVAPSPSALPTFDPPGVSWAVQGPGVVVDCAVLVGYVVVLAAVLFWRFAYYDLR